MIDFYNIFNLGKTMSKHNKTIAQAGFTLVELSIVIVIIGFLVAGIAAGSNLVKQAQVRSVISDFQQFQTGYNGFVGRFNAVPGDFATAYTYWTGAGSCAETATAGLCNGDGDGIVEPGTTSTLDEVSKAWKQMQLAGFVGAGIVVVPTTLVALTPGANAPNSKISGTGYFISGTADLTRGSAAVAIGFGAGSTNYVYIGRATSTANVLNLVDGALRPEEAFNIDSKLDDGVASGANFIGFNTGVVRSVKGSSNTTLTCLLGNDAPATATSYAVAQTGTTCMLALALN